MVSRRQTLSAGVQAGSGDRLAPLARLIEIRFEEAADTLRRLPPGDLRFLRDIVSSWPQAIYQKSDWWAGGGPEVRLRRSPATPSAIGRLDEVLGWLPWLDPDERWVVMARAVGLSWRRMTRARPPGRARSHEALRRIHAIAITKIAVRLLAADKSAAPD